MSSPSKAIPKLLDFLNLCARIEGTPGFSTTALGLSHGAVSKDLAAVSFDASAKALKLRFSLESLPMRVSSEPVSLSTYMAMMDDITTWALVLADAKRGRAGKSIRLHAAWNPAPRPQQPTEVEFTATVKKIGQNIGFASAEIRVVGTNALICYGSHVKYMPMGPFTDFALSSTGWELTKLYSEYVLSEPRQLDKSARLMESFRLHNDTVSPSSTIFTFTPCKAHASLGGPIHGGCQAMLMERAATQYVEGDMQGGSLTLDSISVDYMSPPKARVVHLHVQDAAAAGCNTARKRPPLLQTLRVQLRGGENGLVMSEGLLCFSRRL